MESEPVLLSRTEALLNEEGYRLVADAWQDLGRRTYLHDEDSDRNFLKRMTVVLRIAGWQTNPNKLRSFCHQEIYEIELEPGGADVSGHFLHLIDLRFLID